MSSLIFESLFRPLHMFESLSSVRQVLLRKPSTVLHHWKMISTDTGNQQAMLDIGAELDSCCSEYVVARRLPTINPGSRVSIHDAASSASSFLDSNRFLSNETKFNEYVQIFLSTPEGQFTQDIKFDSNGRGTKPYNTRISKCTSRFERVTALCITHYVTNTILSETETKTIRRGTTNEGSANGM